MRKKGKAHEGLSLLFQRDGVPNAIICDGSKEQVQGQFCHKCNQAGCCIKKIEPHSPWMNTGKREIKELKCGSG